MSEIYLDQETQNSNRNWPWKHVGCAHFLNSLVQSNFKIWELETLSTNAYQVTPTQGHKEQHYCFRWGNISKWYCQERTSKIHIGSRKTIRKMQKYSGAIFLWRHFNDKFLLAIVIWSYSNCHHIFPNNIDNNISENLVSSKCWHFPISYLIWGNTWLNFCLNGWISRKEPI